MQELWVRTDMILNCTYEQLKQFHGIHQFHLILDLFVGTVKANPSFVAYLEEQIELLSTNDNVDTNPSTLWEMLKAYLRGAIVSYCTARKKRH